jgi:hypothetical protein
VLPVRGKRRDLLPGTDRAEPSGVHAEAGLLVEFGDRALQRRAGAAAARQFAHVPVGGARWRAELPYQDNLGVFPGGRRHVRDHAGHVGPQHHDLVVFESLLGADPDAGVQRGDLPPGPDRPGAAQFVAGRLLYVQPVPELGPLPDQQRYVAPGTGAACAGTDRRERRVDRFGQRVVHRHAVQRRVVVQVAH